MVDEAHDLTPALLSAVEGLVGPDGGVHLFGDENQRVLDTAEAAVPSPLYQTGTLDEICRCVSPIRRLLETVMPGDGDEDEFPLEAGQVEFVTPEGEGSEGVARTVRRIYAEMGALEFAEADVMVVVGSEPADQSDQVIDAYHECRSKP